MALTCRSGSEHEGEIVLRTAPGGRRDWIAFQVGPVRCAIPLQRVLSVAALSLESEELPGPGGLRGGVKLGEALMPLKDLGVSLGTGAIPATRHTVVLVVSIAVPDAPRVQLALLVDRLVGVFELGERGISPPSAGWLAFDRARAIGLGRDQESQAFLLDVDALLTDAERAEALRMREAVGTSCA